MRCDSRSRSVCGPHTGLVVRLVCVCWGRWLGRLYAAAQIGCCSVLSVLPQIMREPVTARCVTVYEHRLQASAVCAWPSV